MDPSKAVEAVVTLHDSLSKLSGDIKICDPYIDSTTIEHLDSCPSKSSILLLTKNINDSGKLKRILSAIRADGHRIYIRKSVNGRLHDRYILDSNSMLILGTSLNGFGTKTMLFN